MYKKRASFLILLALSFLLLTSCEHKKIPKSTNGILNLSNWDFENNGKIPITGDWEFYYSKLLEPSEIPNHTPDNYTNILGIWNNIKINNKEIPHAGYATYHMKILYNNNDRKLALKLGDISSSYNLYINGELISSNGLVGKTLDTTIGKYEPKVVSFYPDEEIDIVFQISNFQQPIGQLWSSIIIGTEKQIFKSRESSISVELFVSGSLFIMFLSYLVIYLLNYKNSDSRNSLHFSIFCLIVSLRTVLTGQRYIVQIFPNINWNFMFSIEYLTYYLGLLNLIILVYYLFGKSANKYIVKIICTICIISSVIVIITPPRIFAYTLKPFQIFSFIVSFYIFHILVKALLHKKEGSLAFSIGVFVFLVLAFNDIFYVNGIINTGFYTSYGLLIFVFCNSFILSKKFSNAFINSQKLTQEITLLNENLEKKVEERTQELKKIATTDSLTKLYNHKYMFDMLEMKIDECKRYLQTFSVIMFDIDHFKQVNDTYGHQNGDEVLISVSKCLSDGLRTTDILGRYGGEEFIAILPGTDLDGAFILAERLRKSISELEFSQDSLKITISGGISQFRNTSAIELVKEADKLLYKAKKNGRNRIEKNPLAL